MARVCKLSLLAKADCRVAALSHPKHVLDGIIHAMPIAGSSPLYDSVFVVDKRREAKVLFYNQQEERLLLSNLPHFLHSEGRRKTGVPAHCLREGRQTSCHSALVRPFV